MEQQRETQFEWNDALRASRDRLVRLCAHLSGDPNAAEDLAQETLLEAWRHAAKLHDPTGYLPWLWAIARNVCLRQARHRQREATRVAAEPIIEQTTWLSEDPDLEIDLERDELAALLDRAMALLSPVTRSVLIERYIQESPQADVAARLGLSEGAVAVRLHRGKLALRRVLSSHMQDNAAAYGLMDPSTSGWQQTHLWCPTCGAHRLLMRFADNPQRVVFRCPGCEPDPSVPASQFPLENTTFARLIGGLTRPKVVYNKTSGWVHEYYRAALDLDRAPCTNCGRLTRLRWFNPDDDPARIPGRHGVYVLCDACGEGIFTSFKGLVVALPDVRQFWADHKRMRTLPNQDIEVEGRPALLARFESATSQAAIEVISLRETYEVIAVHRAPSAAGR